MNESPAEIVIGKLGGHQAVAAILKVDLSRVYRWTYPRERGGTGGRIPGDHQEKLLIAAAKRGVNLRPADFFPPQKRSNRTAA